MTEELVAVSFEANGREFRVEVHADEVLVETLRDRCGLPGTKLGCGVGVCGICTVLIDGEMASACLLPTILADGRRIVTIEGLADEASTLTAALADAFEAQGGYQCGICTPGQLVASVALLRETPEPTDQQIRSHLAGNLCRCTGYAGIVAAIDRAARETTT